MKNNIKNFLKQNWFKVAIIAIMFWAAFSFYLIAINGLKLDIGPLEVDLCAKDSWLRIVGDNSAPDFCDSVSPL